ncbi:MmcB family DNA repair protein [Pelagibius litoralis]|uniref:MmcB family DNA repair protein n=1 Tax=Pelagibius litoralis TaxID=374515 RepID=A0A967C7Z9_9PROT|nr:MmcB family DNA repair protein [Pelagibius litoralis]NIA68092.1 MmcB family DNA repair protein [Pelagibius litoralis]
MSSAPSTNPDDAPSNAADNGAASGRRNTAALLTRGLMRFQSDLGLVCLSEFTLRSGRRADLMCLDPKGGLTVVEIKSSVEDFRNDQKWPDYLDYCDRFYFAVPESFPQQLIPADQGLLVADAYGATLIREAEARPLNAARRKSVTRRFAQLAARRLTTLLDPEGFSAPL